MDCVREQGQHKIYTFDKTRHAFLEFFQDLFSTSEIEKLSLDDEEFQKAEIHDVESRYHKKFYNEIKTNPRF